MNITTAIKSFFQRVVTWPFIGAMAHCWFAYSMLMTWPSWRTAAIVGASTAIKEFYVDKHFEHDQTFKKNALDWLYYLAGLALAAIVLIHRHQLAL
ncbi:MAG: hypothetical protein KGL39_14655 [Patescibacteria group bacterium]|nr:hypothetical protein [Patescibacteria group bacterium]